MQGMHKLEKVEIDECDELRDVFVLDEGNEECLSYLKCVELYNSNALMCIWKGPNQLVNLKSLASLTVRYCESLPSLFSVSLAKTLGNLEFLDVGGCDGVECVIAEHDGSDKKEEILEDEEDMDAMEEIVLPKLRKLCLEELQSLVVFSSRGYHFKFPSLQLLQVKKCPEMRTSFYALPDASVHAKTEATKLKQATEIESKTTQLLVAPRSENDDLEWNCSEGKWISKKSAEKEGEKEEEDENEDK